MRRQSSQTGIIKKKATPKYYVVRNLAARLPSGRADGF